MLTSDLVRTRIRKGKVTPSYLDTSLEEAVAKATLLTRVYSEGLNTPRSAILALVDEAVGYGTDFLIWRGLAKLLDDRSTFETQAVVDPVELRRVVFEAAVRLGPVVTSKARDLVFEDVAQTLSITPEDVAAGLYADLADRQMLTAHKSLTPINLLHRYNLALAQAVLYKATKLEITLKDPNPNQLRYLFQSLKFFRLMHRAYRTKDGGYMLEVDGPASLFSKSRKYGLQMATFLPALVATQGCSFKAVLDWERGKDRTFELSEKSGLVSHYTMRGQWLSDDEKMFEDRFAQKERAWTLDRRGALHDLDRGEVLVSDYILTHKEDGQEVFVEVVGFWRKSYLERRIEMLSHLKGVPIVIVVSERLKADRDKLETDSPAVVFYKGVIRVEKVLEAAKEVCSTR